MQIEDIIHLLKFESKIILIFGDFLENFIIILVYIYETQHENKHKTQVVLKNKKNL